MEQWMVTIYCLIDEYWKEVLKRKEHVLSEISDSEILFLGYLAASDFNGNYKKAHFI